MSNFLPDKNIPSAWNALMHSIENGVPPDVALMRAAFKEHDQGEIDYLGELYCDAMELRNDWVEDALIVLPAQELSLEQQVRKTVQHHAETAPKPLLPRFPWIAKIPLLRRWLR